VDKNVALVVALVIGAVVALQGPLNSQLARSTGGLPATTIALGISFVSLLLLTAVSGQLAGLSEIGRAPVYVIVGGGLVGALYVGSIVWTIRALGVGGLSAATLAGQFAAALTIDHFGWLGVERSPITVAKVSGVLLLAIGTWLVIRD
jgi:bacterial/archaeal transporter family-2 protein